MTNKKLYLLAVLILGLVVCVFSSCGDDDDDKGYQIDEVWKNFNDSLFRAHKDSLEFKGKGDYFELECLTGNGIVYYKRSSDIEPWSPEMNMKSMKVRNPISTDSVRVRYMGWFYAKKTDGSIGRITFDGTEGDFNKEYADFVVNKNLNGFASMLQSMDVDDLNQVQVAIPYNLAYGESGKGTIPGYTTLYFNIYLTDILTKK